MGRREIDSLIDPLDWKHPASSLWASYTGTICFEQPQGVLEYIPLVLQRSPVEIYGTIHLKELHMWKFKGNEDDVKVSNDNE